MWGKLVASLSSPRSGPDPGPMNARPPPARNAGSSTANPDPLTDPLSCPLEDGLQAWGNCFVKVADSLLVMNLFVTSACDRENTRDQVAPTSHVTYHVTSGPLGYHMTYHMTHHVIQLA